MQLDARLRLHKCAAGQRRDAHRRASVRARGGSERGDDEFGVTVSDCINVLEVARGVHADGGGVEGGRVHRAPAAAATLLARAPADCAGAPPSCLT